MYQNQTKSHSLTKLRPEYCFWNGSSKDSWQIHYLPTGSESRSNFYVSRWDSYRYNHHQCQKPTKGYNLVGMRQGLPPPRVQRPADGEISFQRNGNQRETTCTNWHTWMKEKNVFVKPCAHVGPFWESNIEGNWKPLTLGICSPMLCVD